MLFIETNSTAGALNLASEEYFLKSVSIKEAIIMLWRNKPTIVVGAFQNTHEEVNEDFVNAHDIAVIRRTSGGGAVYHDMGNLCFTFIMEQEEFSNTDYSVFLKPVVRALEKLGVKSSVSGRNDLLIDGCKISGSATRLYKNRVLFHGTLLYSSNLDILSKALNVQNDKLVSKGIKSVRSRVTTIQQYLPYKMEVLEFKQKLLEAFFEGEEINEYTLTREEQNAIQRLADEKYAAYQWNYGSNPPTDMVNGQRFTGGKLTVRLSIKQSVISQCHFEGDFLGCLDVKALEHHLVGVPYKEDVISKKMDGIDLGLYFGNITKEQVLSCIMGKELSDK